MNEVVKKTAIGNCLNMISPPIGLSYSFYRFSPPHLKTKLAVFGAGLGFLINLSAIIITQTANVDIYRRHKPLVLDYNINDEKKYGRKRNGQVPSNSCFDEDFLMEAYLAEKFPEKRFDIVNDEKGLAKIIISCVA